MKVKKVTVKWLKSWDACEEGIEWFESQKENEPIKLLKKLVRLKEYSHANYSVVACMNLKQKRMYAIYSAEQVIDIFEKEHPNDDRPRKAIEAAKKALKSNTEKNRAAARDAARVAKAAGDATWAAAWATGAAAWAAWAAGAAAWAAGDSAKAAKVAGDYDWAARDSDWAARDAAKAAMRKKIINYGISLLEDTDNENG